MSGQRVNLAVEGEGGGGAISSVFGRTGVVVAKPGDYTAAQVGADASGAAATAQANAEAAVKLAKLAAIQPFPVDIPDNHGAHHHGKLITDAEITDETKILKSASTTFTAGDVGKYVAICSAGAQAKVENKVPASKIQNNTLCSRIAAFIGAKEVELEVNASHTVTGALALYATDDTVAIQAAINNAVVLAQSTGIGYCEVWFSHAIYGVAGELKTGGITEGNAQITLPVISSTSAGTVAQGQKITIMLKGSSESASLPQWYQKVPQQAGAMLFSFGPREAASVKLASVHAQPEFSAANGCPSTIGGPTFEKGFTGLNFSNMNLVVNGITLSAPSNGTMTGIDAEGISEYVELSLGSYALGIPSLVGEAYSEGVNEFVLPWAGFEGEFSAHKKPAAAVAEPGQGNNDNTMVIQHSVEGHTCGHRVGEHSIHLNIHTIYCLMGAVPTSGHFLHNAMFEYWSVEACTFGIYSPGGGEAYFIIKDYDSENQSGRWGKSFDIYDPENKLSGEVNMFIVAPPPKVAGAARMKITCNAGSGFNNYYNKGSVKKQGIALPAVPATKVFAQNTFWRDAWVPIKAASGSPVKVTVDLLSEFKGSPVEGTKEVKAVALPSPNTVTFNNLGALVAGAILKGAGVEGLEVESYNSGTKVLTLKTNCTATGANIALAAIGPTTIEVPENTTEWVPIPAGSWYALQYAGTAPTISDWI